ncbi:hypothetical protein BT69DRAFT_1283419, partial [Atractiella rhizophila]
MYCVLLPKLRYTNRDLPHPIIPHPPPSESPPSPFSIPYPVPVTPLSWMVHFRFRYGNLTDRLKAPESRCISVVSTFRRH